MGWIRRYELEGGVVVNYNLQADLGPEREAHVSSRVTLLGLVPHLPNFINSSKSSYTIIRARAICNRLID